MEHEEGYYVEHNGDCWQSVFPSYEAHHSQLHADRENAVNYIIETVGNVKITIIPEA